METMDPGVVFGPIADLIADPTVEEIWIRVDIFSLSLTHGSRI